MHTFLDQAAEQIVQSKRDFQSIKIVVPSNRAILFLKEALKDQLQRPHFAPEICAIDQFIEELSGLKKADPTGLLLRFYAVYKNTTSEKEQESFEHYLGWAETILREFNEMDANLVDVNALFKTLEAYKALGSWNTQTPPEQDLLKRYLKFNQSLPALYQRLYQTLLDADEGYSGMRYREAVSNIEHYLEANQKHHFFIGFNALNKAEEFLFQEFLVQQKATPLWDMDQCFYEDGEHPAGHFVRHYFKQWPVLKNQEPPHWTAHFEKEKTIHIVGLPKNIAQAQWATQLLRGKQAQKTALVLGEETLLTPTLAALGENNSSWNATMGYALSETPAATFFELFFALHQDSKSEAYDFYALQNLLSTAQCMALLAHQNQEVQTLMKKYRRQKQLQISAAELLEAADSGSLRNLLFAPFSSVQKFVNRLQQLASHFVSFWSASQSDVFVAASFAEMERVLKNLQSLLEQYSSIKTLADLRHIFKKLLQQEKIPFSGDPFEGLQIMGLLETRLLDFETVVITHLNEGILPGGKSITNWIPFAIKKQFEMPTFVEQDYLYSYHFFRLLQRAKNIYLLYNTTPDGLFGGEKSHFLYQLEYLKKPNHKLVFSQPNLEIKRQDIPKPSVAKSPELLRQLHTLANSGFSPSSLTTFWRDPYQFYERYLLKIEPHQPLENTLQANEKGTLMHAVLETLYAPYTNVTMRPETYTVLKKNLTPILYECFQNEFGNSYQIKGKNFLLFESIKQLLMHFLNEEQNWVAEGNELKIIALEKAVEGYVNLPNSKTKIKLRGFVDRIDKANDQVRIIDYKTGTVQPKSLEISSWENLLEDPVKSPLFQVLLYGYLLQKEFQNQPLSAGVIPFKTYANPFLEATLGSGKERMPIRFSTDQCTAFEIQLGHLLNALFDATLPFIPAK